MLWKFANWKFASTQTHILKVYVMKVCKLEVCFTAHTCFESLCLENLTAMCHAWRQLTPCDMHEDIDHHVICIYTFDTK